MIMDDRMRNRSGFLIPVEVVTITYAQILNNIEKIPNNPSLREIEKYLDKYTPHTRTLTM